MSTSVPGGKRPDPAIFPSQDVRQGWSALLSRLLDGEPLAAEDTAWAMNQVMTGEATSAQIAGLAVALRGKGETVEEVAGLAQAMLSHSTPISVPGPAVDLVGTGGDRAHTVNISTMSAVVAAAAGVRVVKHGNRAASSSCGSADLLERLGVVIDLPPRRTAALAEEVGITFCFASLFHPALRHASAPRRELGVATVFNFLGPLTNPAHPAAAAVGVADRRMCPIMAGVLAGRGDSALVFRGHDGLDELTTTGSSTVWIVRDGTVTETELDPAKLGIPRAEPEALRGGDADYNVRVARAVFAGEPGPVNDAVALNAAAALVARWNLDPASSSSEGAGAPLTESMALAVERCREVLASGRPARLVEHWVSASARPSG